MNRVLLTLMILLISLGAVAATDIGLSGRGTASEPYGIGSDADFAIFDSLLVSTSGCDSIHFRLTDNVIAPTRVNDALLPDFKGYLHGGGYAVTLSGTPLFGSIAASAQVDSLRLIGEVRSSGQGAALAVSSAGRVSDIVVTASVMQTGDYAGGIVCHLLSGGTLSNSVFSGRLVMGDESYYTGGIACEVSAGAVIEDCRVDGVISSQVGYVGGIAYSCCGDILNSVSDADISGATYMGGILYTLEMNGTLRGCINHTPLSAPRGYNIGGILGSTVVGGTALIRGCVNYAPVLAAQYAAGIVARLNGGSVVSACVNRGTIRTPQGTYCGGIAAYVNGRENFPVRVDSCRNDGEVTLARRYMGGLFGYTTQYASISAGGNTASIGGKDCMAAAFVGGVAGATSASYVDCWNYGSVTATEARSVAGLFGEAQAGLSATACFNAGTVTAGMPADGAEGGVAGGVAAAAVNASFIDCYNMGAVMADDYLGGLCAQLRGTSSLIRSYNAGRVISLRDAPIAVTATTSVAAVDTLVTVSEIYYDATLNPIPSLFDYKYAVGLDTDSLMHAPLGETYSQAPACFAIPASLTNNPYALLTSAYVTFNNGDSFASVQNFIQLGMRPGLSWSADRHFVIEQDRARPVEKGNGILTVTAKVDGATEVSRSFEFNVTGLTQGVGQAQSDAALLRTEYYDLQGRRLQCTPDNGIYIMVQTYTDGRVISRKYF